MVMLFKEYVKVDDYKRFISNANKDFYNYIGEYFLQAKDHDKNYNRIYYDLPISKDSFQIVIPDEISDFFNWNRIACNLELYKKGICIKDGREFRIGKLLNMMDEEGLLKTYMLSKENTLKNVDDLQVVISRHPYDIMGMSTNRGWTTCHDINDKRYGGKHLHGLTNNLKRGSLISYLIRSSDRNIQNPISRCLITHRWAELLPDRHIYGTYVKEYEVFLHKWCVDYNMSMRKSLK